MPTNGKYFVEASMNKNISALMEKCVISRESIIYTNQFITKYGEIRWLQTTLTPIFSKNILSKYIAIDSDITKIKLAEAEIAKKSLNIKDSIQYAWRLQNAILPPSEMIRSILGDYFLLFKPKDIVSGDFYWVHASDKRTVVAVADCTGHGVPGAIMSMLGVSLLNQIIREKPETNSNELLELLRIGVKKSLRQTGKTNEAKDGMDISVCIIEHETRKLQFSGAHNSAYFIRNKELTKINADKMPISIYRRERAFTRQEIELEKNDIIYLFSDGYIDQFGGKKNRKFMTGNFKKLLFEHHLKPMDEQLQILQNTMTDWMGDYTQIDDIVVMGIRF